MRALVLTLTLLLGCVRPAEGQRYVVLTDGVRAQLAVDWDHAVLDRFQHERAYCVRYDTMPFAGEQSYRVFAIEPPLSISRTSPYSISFACPTGPNRAALHTHPPTSCESPTKCVFGGADAYECFPSTTDLGTLSPKGDRFGLIQCDRYAVVFFWPRNVTPKPRR